MEKLSDLLSAGARFGLHVRTDGSLKRVDCHIFDALTVKMVVRRLDVDWLKDLLRRTFLRELSGLEPFCVLEYFRFRLAAVIGGSSFNNMPRLREVIDFKFVSAFFFFFSGTGVSMCGNVWSWSASF